MKWINIGEFGVDSGTFMICDPCYLEDKKFLKKILNHDYNLPNETLNFSEGNAGLAFIANTIVGDGLFQIYARQNSKGQNEIKIVFG